MGAGAALGVSVVATDDGGAEGISELPLSLSPLPPVPEPPFLRPGAPIIFSPRLAARTPASDRTAVSPPTLATPIDLGINGSKDKRGNGEIKVREAVQGSMKIEERAIE